jgi:alpha-1,6-mannosyltransferase
VRITPAWRLGALGATLCVALTICSQNFGDRGGLRFMISLAVAGVAYLAAVHQLFATPKLSHHVVAAGLLLAALWHIEFLRLPTGTDDDIHRYVWDGRLQRLGYNPYLVVPSDPAALNLHTPETRNLNNPDLTTPYPPGAEVFFRLVTAIHESAFGLKIAFVLCELAIVFVLLDVLRSNQERSHLVLTFAWNPLLVIEVAGSGHVDIVGALLLLVSTAALARRCRATAAVALALAIEVKFLPIVLLPLYWKRIRIRDAALAAVIFALLYLPFLNHGRIPIGSLGTYVQSFRFNGPVFAALNQFALPQVLAGFSILIGLATAIWLRNTRSDWSRDTFGWPMAASLLFAPVVFPWYLLWLLPFLGSAAALPIIVWTVSIIPVYVQWHLRTLGRPWGALPGWTMLLEYGCVVMTGAIMWFGRVRKPVNTSSLAD